MIEGILRQEMYKKETHEGQTSHHCYCVILHDVDMIPVSEISKYFYRLNWIFLKCYLHANFGNQSIHQLKEYAETPYWCLDQPTLLSVSIQKFNYKIPYENYFGGVVSLRLEHFLSINGLSNR